MPADILAARILITLALVFYSIGVWSERLAGRLKPWHLAFFWLGLVCDTVGTGMMLEMAGGITPTIHAITGLLAISLMLIHALWATVVLLRRDEPLDPQLPPLQPGGLAHLARPVLQPDAPRTQSVAGGRPLLDGDQKRG